MPSIDGVGSSAMAFASEVYSANLAKSAQEQQGRQNLELLSEALKNVTPPATGGSHTTTDNLGQNVNVNV